MTQQPSRRDVLISAIAFTAAASVGGAARARAQGAPRFARIDAAVDKRALAVYGQFERGIYEALNA